MFCTRSERGKVMKAFRSTLSIFLTVIMVLLTPLSAFADGGSGAPKTGDDFPWIYVVLCVAAIAAIAGILISAKKKKKD